MPGMGQGQGRNRSTCREHLRVATIDVERAVEREDHARPAFDLAIESFEKADPPAIGCPARLERHFAGIEGILRRKRQGCVRADARGKAQRGITAHARSISKHPFGVGAGLPYEVKNMWYF